jgi:hypothetical protein
MKPYARQKEKNSPTPLWKGGVGRSYLCDALEDYSQYEKKTTTKNVNKPHDFIRNEINNN